MADTGRYGLCFSRGGSRVRLEQISGDGRLLLRDGQRSWWSKPMKDWQWEVHHADGGQTYPSYDEALSVAQRLAA